MSLMERTSTTTVAATGSDDPVCHWWDVEAGQTFCGLEPSLPVRTHSIEGDPHPCSCGRPRCQDCDDEAIRRRTL